MLKFLTSVLVVSTLSGSSYAAPGTSAATYIGTVDGKFFFCDNNFTGNWASAGSACEGENMKLASLNSTAQVTLIRSFANYVSNTYYWTSAQEIDTAARFAWSTNQATVDPLSIPLSTKPPTTYCMAFHSGTSSATSSFAAVSCTSTGRVLCEIS